MSKKNKLYVLLGVLVAISLVTVLVSKHEEKKEEIKNSGEEILAISKDDVTQISWNTGKQSLSFSKSDDTWKYDEDENFPVDEDKINSILEQFESFSSQFVIENVTDYSQYGLDDPTCTINIFTEDNAYTIKLGDFSSMDEERYVDIGDGNVYLATSDPYDSVNVKISSLVKDDEIPAIKDVTSISFTGNENYTIAKQDESTSICTDDLYYTDSKPLDSDLISSYVSAINNVTLSGYVSYNVTEEELSSYGLDNPDLTINVVYGDENDEITLEIGSNKEEMEKYNEAVEKDSDDLPDVTRYIRVKDSQLVYELSESNYTSLTAASYNDLRHQKLFTGDFDEVSSIEVTLDSNTYTFTKEDDTWKYNDDEITVDTLESSIKALSASEFTSDTSSNQKEVSITLNLDNESYPTFKIDLYRVDGEKCLAYVDDTPIAYVLRTTVVDLIEAINKIIL